jgi:glycosyltransferase involved in cell wall biosynthesis
VRIAFAIPYFYPAWEFGGPPRSAYELAQGLVGAGHEVKVFTTDAGGERRISPDDVTEAGRSCLETRYYRNVSNYMAFRHRLFLPPTMALNLKRELRGVDVLHIHELRSMTSVIAQHAARNLSVPYVVSPHGGLLHLGKSALKRGFDALWGRRIVRDATALTVVSDLEARQALGWGVPDDRIRRLPNPIRAEDYSHLPEAGSFRKQWGLDDRNVILFLGRLNRIKGVDLLIQACGRLDLDHSLVIAGGDDGQEPTLRELASKQLGDAVTFTGFLNHREKLSAMADADVCVLPSRSEIFGMVALESLMCGTPVVLSSACGLASELRHSSGVFEFENGNQDDLIEKLTSAITSEAGRSGLAMTREQVMGRFSLVAVVADAESVYEKCLSRV